MSGLNCHLEQRNAALARLRSASDSEKLRCLRAAVVAVTNASPNSVCEWYAKWMPEVSDPVRTTASPAVFSILLDDALRGCGDGSVSASRAVWDEVEARAAGTFRAPADEPSGLTAQRRYLAQQAMLEQPCWACGRACSQLQAGGDEWTLYGAFHVLSYDLQSSASDPKHADAHSVARYTCIWCSAPLECVVPFVSVDGRNWHWSRPANVRVVTWVVSGEVER